MTVPIHLRRPWRNYTPRARAVLLFAGLGLLYTLLTALVFPSNWEYLYLQADGTLRWPLDQPLQWLPRLATAALTALVVAWLLRPGRRTWPEFLLGGLSLLTYAALVAYSYDLSGAVLVIPVVLRAWWSLRRTLLTCAPFLLLGLALNLGYLPGAAPPQGSAESLVQSGIYLTGQGLLLFIAFELTLRRGEDREQLQRALDELRQYRDLELRHAALEERTRVSRELHDTLGHELTALRLEVQHARRVQDRPEVLAASLGRALDRSTESMVSLQAAVRAARPQRLGTSLLGSVEELVRIWPQHVALRLPDGEPALSDDGRLAAFRCVQEGLTNAQKHAPQAPLVLELVVERLALQVTLRNPARVDAAPQENSAPTGLGLVGLRERVEAVGGHLTAGVADGEFCLRATFPLVNA